MNFKPHNKNDNGVHRVYSEKKYFIIVHFVNLFLILILLSTFNCYSKECDTTFKLQRIVFEKNKIYSNKTISLSYNTDFYLYDHIRHLINDSTYLSVEKCSGSFMEAPRPFKIRYILSENNKVIKDVTFTNTDIDYLLQIFSNCMYEEVQIQDSTFSEFFPFSIRDFTRSLPHSIDNSDFLNFAEKFRNDSCGCKQYRNKDNIDEFILDELLDINTNYSNITVNIGEPDSIIRYPELENRVDLLYYYQSECKDGQIVKGSIKKWIILNYNTQCHEIREVEWHSDGNSW